MYFNFEITAASSNNGGGRVLGSCVCNGIEQVQNLAVHFDFVFPVEVLVVRICIRLHLCRNKLYQVPHFIFL